MKTSEKRRIYKREWEVKHRVERKLYLSEYRKRNASRIKETYRAWRKRNPDKVMAQNRRRHLKRYPIRKNDPRWMERKLFLNQNRSAAIRGATGKYTLVEWKTLKDKYHHQCLACGMAEPKIVLTVDHVVPISLGGSNTIENIQPLCRSCNSRKHTKVINYINVT